MAEQQKKKQQEEYMKIKASLELADEPDELVENLSDFLMDVGFNTSFLDDEFKLRED